MTALTLLAVAMTPGCLGSATPALAADDDPARRVELLVAPPGAAADLVVLEDGQRVTGLEVGEVTEEWRVVLLFDQLLSSPLVIRSAALELASLATMLTGLGAVEVVTAGEEVALSLPPTRDAVRLAQGLEWISVRESGAGGQLEVRKRFLTSPPMTALAADEYSAVSATAGRRLAELGAAARGALQEEVALLEAQRGRLLAWLAEEADARPRLLVLVSEGWDESPVDYYRKVLKRVRMSEVGEGLAATEPGPPLDTLGRTLAATGWRLLAFTPSRRVEPEEDDGGAESDEAVEGDDQVETVVQDGREVDRTLLTGVDPRQLWRRLSGGPLEAELLAGDRPLADIATATGGRRVGDRRQVERFLSETAALVRLSYPRPEAAPLDDWRRVEVRRPGGAPIDAPRWVRAFAPEILAEARARRLFDADLEEGDLMVAARYLAAEGTVSVEAAAPAGAVSPAAPLRATLAATDVAGAVTFAHFLLAPEDLRPVADTEGAVGFRLPSVALADPDAFGMVLIEELESGTWGSGFVRFEGGDTLAAAEGSFVLPAPKAVHLLMPSEPMLLGSTSFDTVAGERVARVDFYLDGELATTRAAAPFSARLDLGRLPRPRRVEAVAYDGGGRVLGRDSLTVNEGTGNFRVRILRPSADQLATATEPRVGSLEVEAGVRIPGGGRLERLEFYWKESLVGTRYAPPYVQRVNVPAAQPTGFLRVVGYLEDGSSAEDVAFVNSPAGSENLRVELVELYTVVTDRRGRPVRDLTEADFRVVEDGVEQEIATFSDAGERPLTVGLAIDSSASMFVKLPEVQLAAATFLTGLTSRRDRAFVVGFGDEPFLQRDTTSDLSAVRGALASLEPAGRTSIWKGIAYSLVQLQGVPGKKALIVFSDGADEDPDFSYRLAHDFARRVGVPVYIVVSNDEIYRTQGKGLTIRGFMNRLESLARAVGGRVFVTRVGEDLQAIYREIDEELRSQYLLGYYVQGRDEEEWRPVTVEVDRPGARARTVAGYYQ